LQAFFFFLSWVSMTQPMFFPIFVSFIFFDQLFFFVFWYVIVLRTPQERLASGGPKKEFGRMIFQKKSSLPCRSWDTQ